MVRDLTPYDTGERAEPRPWPTGGGSVPREEYGRVDFDNDESATVLTVWVEHRPEGGWKLAGYGHGNDITIDLDEVDDGWENTIPREIAGALRDRGNQAAAEWLQQHESDDDVWQLIGGLLDRFEEMAAEGGE